MPMSAQSQPHPITIAFVPRETINQTVECLATLIEHTPEPFHLIAVTGGYPQAVVDEMKPLVDACGGELLAFDHFLTPNEARNEALERTDTDKIVFVDHDAFVTPNWLDPLVECASETSAAVVGPLLFEGPKGQDASIWLAGKPTSSRMPMARQTMSMSTTIRMWS